MIINLPADFIFVAPFGLLLVGVVAFLVTRRRRRRAEINIPRPTSVSRQAEWPLPWTPPLRRV